jgi:type II secretory pathway pseudopilin PulG
VVIAIIGVLIALLLPAVQAAREAARRMQCSNNQRQVVLAMHNYHDTQQSFPCGAYGDCRGTWAMCVLAFIEKNSIAEKYDWNDWYYDGVNEPLMADLVISTYTCPSDGNNNKASDGWEVDREHNYVVCMGREGVYCPSAFRSSDLYSQNCLISGPDGVPPTYDKQSPYNAMFTASCYFNGYSGLPYPFTTTFADIIDGTSNTVALSETIQGVGPDDDNPDYRGLIWWGLTCFFNTNLPPNTMSPDINWPSTVLERHPTVYINTSVSDPDGRYLRMSARSWHVGGVNAGLADGSIRFVTDQVNLGIWRAVGSTNGSEIESLH